MDKAVPAYRVHSYKMCREGENIWAILYTEMTKQLGR